VGAMLIPARLNPPNPAFLRKERLFLRCSSFSRASVDLKILWSFVLLYFMISGFMNNSLVFYLELMLNDESKYKLLIKGHDQ
jgi:hypothetical protein